MVLPVIFGVLLISLIAISVFYFLSNQQKAKPSKKVKDKLIQLLIPADAKRSSATTNKCRCDKAKVVAITDIDGSRPVDSITCNTYVKTEYKVGEYVYPDLWDDNRWKECSHGIHFFINKQDAINY